MPQRLVAFVLLGVACAAFAADQKPDEAKMAAPKAEYEKQEIHGWTVFVDKRLLTEKALRGADALELLRAKLFEIQLLVPARAVAELKKVHIYMDSGDPRHPGCCYHPSKEWLVEHGYPAEKAKTVQVSNPATFLAWTRDQPGMVLHEMAHAYHHQVLGYDNAEIKAAYKQAVESKTYDAVLHISGKTERHYAMNNDQEYFAEMSEAYFTGNDFYPFVRGELRKHDPTMFALVKKLWER